MDANVIDTGIHQWTFGPNLLRVRDRLSPEQFYRQAMIDRNEERPGPLSGTLMPTLPGYHAYWNEDAPGETDPAPGDKYSSPDWMDERLEKRDVDVAILGGHEIQFLPGLLEPGYKAQLCSVYNDLLLEEWVAQSPRFKAAVVVSPDDPEGAVQEIRRHADHDDVVTVTVFSGDRLPLGHPQLFPIYEAIEKAGVPLTIYTSGNPVHRQTALGQPDHFVTRDVNLVQNHMVNLANMLLNGVFAEFPDLEVVWAGEGAEWAVHTMWRTTRYYREFKPMVPYELPKSPEKYVKDRCYFTTYPLGRIEPEVRSDIYNMIGPENVLYASGYPRWDHDSAADIEELPEGTRERILSENARDLYGL